MTTTQLFVELLIIGFGVVIWVGVLVAALFGYNFKTFMSNINVAILTPLLAFSYVIGIVLDRIAHRLFRNIEEKNRLKIFGRDSAPSPEDKERYVILKGDKFRSQITYNRSRLRICRSWSINFLFISMALLLWQLRNGYFNKYQLILLLSAILLMAILCYYVTSMLSVDHFLNIQNTYKFLNENANNKKGHK